MIDIQFEIDGKAVKTNNIADALERAMFDSIADSLRTTLGSVRDPDTGEFPTVFVRGSSLENMSISVEGSDAVVALATERLQEDFEVTESPESDAEVNETPYVFLCHASEDKLLVDLNYDEDSHEKGVDVPVAMMPRTGDVTLLQMDGAVTKDELKEILKTANKACQQIYKVQKEAIKARYKR